MKKLEGVICLVLALFLCCDEVRSATDSTAVMAANVSCEIVGGPEQQPGDLGVCRLNHARRPTDRDAAGWIQAVADQPGGTVEVIQATLYGVREDGSRVPLAGTALGQPAVDWAGLWTRNPWFPDDRHAAIQVTSGRLSVPTDRVLHGGISHADIAGFADVIFVVRVRTSGDVRVQVGIDLRERSGSPVNEYSLSDWFHSGSSGTCVRSTATLRSPQDCTVMN
jgi:hypothetical protein